MQAEPSAFTLRPLCSHRTASLRSAGCGDCTGGFALRYGLFQQAPHSVATLRWWRCLQKKPSAFSLRQIREMVATLPAHGTAFASSGALITIKKLALLRAARFLMVARPPGRAPCGRPPARPALMPIPRLRAFASVLASRPGRAVVATLPHYLSAPAPKAATS